MKCLMMDVGTLPDSLSVSDLRPKQLNRQLASMKNVRCLAFGVNKDKKIFVAGGIGEYWEHALKSC